MDREYSYFVVYLFWTKNANLKNRTISIQKRVIQCSVLLLGQFMISNFKNNSTGSKSKYEYFGIMGSDSSLTALYILLVFFLPFQTGQITTSPNNSCSKCFTCTFTPYLLFYA